MFDNTRDGILAADATTRQIVYANPAMCRLLGYDKLELLALTPEDLLGGELAGAWFARIPAGETGAAGTFPALRKDGATIHCGISAPALTIEGRQCLLGVFQDATSQQMTEPALRLSEERLEAVLDAGDLGFFDWDLRTGEVYFSPRYYTMLGYEPGAFPASWESFAELLHPDDMHAIQAVMEDYSAGRSERHAVEIRLKSRGGDWLWILSRGKVTARDEEGRPRRMIGTHADVTWRRTVEQELRIKEMALASAIAGAVMAGMDGRITYANQAYLEMHGYSAAAEVLGTTPLDHVEQPADAQAIIEAIGRQGKWVGEVRCRRRDGTVFPAEMAANLVSGPSGEPLCMLASFQDITARRRAEEALRLSKVHLRQAQEIAQIGNWELDLATGRLWWSDEIFRLFELDAADFGASYEAFLAAIHPDDRDQVHAAYRRSLQERTPYMATHRLLTAGGRVKYVEERCVSDFAADGSPLRSRGTVQDVTARVEAEAALKAARDELEATLQAIPDLLFEMDGDGRYLAFRAQRPELLAAPGDQLLRRDFREILPADASGAVLDAIREAAERGVSFGRVIRLAVPAGERWFELSVARKAAAPGGEPTYIVLSHDITERAQAEQQLRQSVAEKETMLREIHHRVKNNLQIISSLLHFQAKKVKDPADLVIFSDMRERLRTLMLVHEHLYQSRALNRIELGGFVRFLTSQLAEAYARHGQRITTRVEAGDCVLPIEIAQPCGLIICELAINAFKYAFPGGRDGELAVRIAGEDGRLAVTVSDNGAGLPEGFDPRTAESFGWQSIRGLCAQLGGTVTAASGPGTTVTISFPHGEGAR
ncbi:MAG: PAS domain S-box protein [Candidatus Solibacter usitatus]|nr:PAS domain S-box protein [Candidatus Solibacter usitatus]